MNYLEKKMLNILKELRAEHKCIGVKAEFEAEGTRMQEAMRLKEVVTRAGLDLTIKIGGCEALKDMYDARDIGANAIVAPMVESVYATKKFLMASKAAFPQDEWEDTHFLINVETITTINCLEDIFTAPFTKDLFGVVLGRSDMCGSLGLTKADTDSEQCFKVALKTAQLCEKYGKKMVIGGNITPRSISFLQALPSNPLWKIETRKIVFDAKALLADSDNIADAFAKAIAFELLWLQNKRDYYGHIYKEDLARIINLEERCKKSDKGIICG